MIRRSMIAFGLRLSFARRGSLALAAIVAAAGLAQSAAATWSIILIDTRTGEIAVGSATCLTGFDLRANTPVLITGIGAATAQSQVDSTGLNRMLIRDRLLRGDSLETILAALASFDAANHQRRQYGIGDTRAGGHGLTFTGSLAGQYRGGQVGRIVGAGVGGGDIVYAIQGNVLTGAPVITQAVLAVQQTPGDLPAKLMAAMEAARAMGGDGRCSCNAGNPTGCGSPPVNFTKSSHIAYMLIARAGDRDGCNGMFRTGIGPYTIGLGDLNADGLQDMVSVNTGGANVGVHLALNNPQSPYPTYADRVLYTTGATPREIVVADFTGDGIPDVAVTNLSGDSVSLLRNTGGGILAPRIDTPAGDGATGLISGDFDRDGDTDLAVANNISGDVSILVNDGTGNFLATAPTAAGGGLVGIAAADMDGDLDLDLVVAAATPGTIVVLRNDTPAPGMPPIFVAEPPVTAGAGLTGIALADFNGDGRIDAAVSGSGGLSVHVLLRTDSGFALTDLAGGVSPGNVVATDVNGDTHADLLAASRSGATSQLGVLLGRGDGTFRPLRQHLVGILPSRIAGADLDRDGDPDVVLALSSATVAMSVQNIGGVGDAWRGFNDGLGCATGDYFMEFNIANSETSDPDPVFTLQSLFSRWRADLSARPDAVYSLVTLDPPSAPAGGNPPGSARTRMHVSLRDWQGNAVSAAGRIVHVEHGPGSAGLSTLSAPTVEADGTLAVVIDSPFQAGVDLVRIRIDPVGPESDTNRAVTLMPLTRLTLPIHADFNLDGGTDVFDVYAYLAAFFAAAPAADYNADGQLGPQDLFDFVAAWFTVRV